MTEITKFIEAVEKMRTLQKSYFKEKEKEKKQSLLIESKQSEKQVDTMIIKLQTEGYEL